jgi:hypothetical protein
MPAGWVKTIIGVGGLFAISLGLVGPALAQRTGNAATAPEDSPHFHLTYVAPADCPDRNAFLGAIRARTPRPQLAADDEVAVTFVVTLEVEPTGSTGHLDVREPDGDAQKRSVSSRTCSEVARALALVVALVLDPDALTAPEPAIVEPPTTPPAPSPAAGPAAASPPQKPRQASPAPAPPRKAMWRAAGGVEIGALGGVAPAVAPLFGAFADLELVPSAASATSLAAGHGMPKLSWPVLLTPSFRVTARFAASSSDLPAGSQTYWWTGGTFRVCPIHLPLPRRFRVGPCGAFEVAAHYGTTQGVPNPSSNLDLWLAPEAGGSFEWAASPALTFELQGGAVFPMRRTRFFLAPSTTLFEVPTVSATGTVALRLRFR